MLDVGGLDLEAVLCFHIPQPKATLAIGPGAGFGLVLFIFGDASVVAEGRGVAPRVSVIPAGILSLFAVGSRCRWGPRADYERLMWVS